MAGEAIVREGEESMTSDLSACLEVCQLSLRDLPRRSTD